ncbi:hypothetical protein ACVIU7_002565 [Bradyrhizobium liaoningense]
MPGLVPGIHVLCAAWKGVDGRDKPGHDAVETVGTHSHVSYAIALPLWERVARRDSGETGEGSLSACKPLASEYAEATPHPALRATFSHKGRRCNVACGYFILHLSWKRSWSFSTMVATVFSASWPSESLTTSCR